MPGTLTPWPSSLPPDRTFTGDVAACPAQAPLPNPIAAEPGDGRVLSSLKERAGVKRGSACGFAVVCLLKGTVALSASTTALLIGSSGG